MAVALGTTSWLTLRQHESNILRETQRHGMDLARIVAQSLSYSVIGYDYNTIQQLLLIAYDNRSIISRLAAEKSNFLSREAVIIILIVIGEFLALSYIIVRHGDINSILIIDVDHFKRVNDTYGHKIGDHVLIEISRLRGVHSGDFDAGILKDTTAFKWKAKGLRILHASPDLPPYNIVVSHRVTDQQMRAIRNAFLSLDKKIRCIVLLRALDKEYDGFVATDDKEYEVVRQLVAPFAPKK